LPVYNLRNRHIAPEAQFNELEKSGQLEMLSEPAETKIENNQLKIKMKLPRQAVSLIKLQLTRN
jgi:hypothetical protein